MWGVPLSEVDKRCTHHDLLLWSAYFTVKNEREKEAMEKARREAEARAKNKGR